ncbi:MAG: hypothetical protein ACJA0J_001758, partial [Bdellovibrionota bacterium]
VDNAVVLARLFNEASGQKAPSKKHGLFISRPLASDREVFYLSSYLLYDCLGVRLCDCLTYLADIFKKTQILLRKETIHLL